MNHETRTMSIPGPRIFVDALMVPACTLATGF